MSFAIFQQLTQNTVIDACLFTSFTSAQATNLVINKGNCIEVYDVQRRHGKLTFAFSAPLFGRAEAIGAFRPSPNGPDHLAVVLRRARYLAVLRHNPSLGNVQTCGQHLLIAPDDPASVSGPPGFRAQVAVDPGQRCLAVRVLPDRVLVFPVADGASWQREAGPAVTHRGGLAFHEDSTEQPPGLGTPFALGAHSPLRLHHIQDIAFLHGYHQPTAVCLGQTKPAYGGCLNEANLCTSSVLVFMLDLTDRTPHLIWAAHRLPHDIFQIVPLLPPLGGMLALCSNAVIYMKEHGASFCQTLNPCAGLGEELSKLKSMEFKDETKLEIVLSGCAASALSPTTILFSIQPSGRLYLAHLVLESYDAVADIVWTSPGTASPASGICSLGEEYIFLSASAGGCSLLKAQASKKKLPPNLQRLLPPPRKRARTDEHDPNEAAEKDGGEARPEAEGAEKPPPSEHLAALLEAHRGLADAGRYIRSYNISVADEIQSFGAIQGLAQWCKDRGDEAEEEDDVAPLRGTERLICCSGAGQKGALYICQRAVPLEILTEFDLPESTQFSAVWTFSHPDEEPVIADAVPLTDEGAGNEVARASAAAGAAAAAASRVAGGTLGGRAHRLVLLSGGFKSMVLETTEEIEEISKATRFDTNATTLAAGSLLCDRCVVQVTPHRLCFVWAHTPKSETVPRPLEFQPSTEGAAEVAAAPVQACGGSVCDPYVVIRFHDLSLRLFAFCGEDDRLELTSHLPQPVRGSAVCASFFRKHGGSKTLLTALAPENDGTLRIVDLDSMAEVFRAEHVLDVPPVLRNHLSGGAACALDHLRAVPDVCAPLPRSAGDPQQLARAKAQEGKPEEDPQKAVSKALATAVCAELVEVDADDVGPSLVLLCTGRPVLVYRAFLPESSGPQPGAEQGAAQASFPYHFTVFEHDMLGLVERTPNGPHRAVAPLRQGGGSPAGAVVVPPHTGIPALWLVARRNKLFVHPLPGTQVCGFSQLKAPCCGNGFFGLALPQEAGPVAAQVLAPAVAGGLAEGQNGFDLHGPLPLARKPLQRTPQVLATHSKQGMIGLAVAEPIFEKSESAGPSAEEDPLAEDWSIVRAPPVESEPPPVPRTQPQYELWIDKAKDISKLGQYRFSFDSNEHVLCMEWVTLPGFPEPSLAVGTGVNIGEDLTCRGRILIFSTKDRDPGVVPAMYQRSLKWPVTVVGQWGSYLVHSEGFKLFFERWENNNFNKLAFFDASMCVTSMSSIKNFLLLGDLRKGLDFVQWKEEAGSQTRNLRRLSRSPPSSFMTVLACDFVVCGKSLGLVALDHTGTANLYQYSPHSDGREGDQLLRSCATFFMGSPCRAALRLQTDLGVQCLFMASGGGELLCLKPIDDQVYRTVATLLGMLATRLPYRGGLNPRAFRHHDGTPALVAPRKNIEDAVLLRLFAFLSAPLQASIAEKMRLPVAAIMKVTTSCATSQLFNLAPSPAPGPPPAGAAK